MSSYRDDVNDTAVASSTLLTLMRNTAEGTAFARAAVIERLRATTNDTALASDEALDRSYSLLQAGAVASDSVLVARTVRQIVSDVGKAKDAMLYREAPLLQDAALVSVTTEHKTCAVVHDSARADELVLARCTVRQLVEDSASGFDALAHRAALPLITELAAASANTEHRTHVQLAEGAIAGDQVLTAYTAHQLLTDSARVGDAFAHRSTARPLEGVAVAADSLQHRTRALLVDAGKVGDSVAQARTTRQLVTDTARGADTLAVVVRDLGDGTAFAAEAWRGMLHAAVVVDEVAAASEFVLDAYQAKTLALESGARASEVLFGTLHARQLLLEVAAIEDEVIQSGMAGQAWTADSGGWAMSRWAPLDFTGLAVIDGALYGTNARGVFAMDSQAEVMDCEIRTGLVDVGGEALAHIEGSYLEYRLDGSASLEVTQTQQGTRQTYAYALPDKPAGELTSGRFVTGRGLRSRHYEFSLRLHGASGHINDWRLMLAPSKRRL